MLYENKLNGEIIANLPCNSIGAKLFEYRNELHLISPNVSFESHYVYRNNTWLKLNNVAPGIDFTIFKDDLYMIDEDKLYKYDNNTDDFKRINTIDSNVLKLDGVIWKKNSIEYDEFIVLMIQIGTSYCIYKLNMYNYKLKWELVLELNDYYKIIKTDDGLYLLSKSKLLKLDVIGNETETILTGLKITNPTNSIYYHYDIYSFSNNKVFRIKNYHEIIIEDIDFDFEISEDSPIFNFNDCVYCGVSKNESICTYIASIYNKEIKVPISYFPNKESLKIKLGSTSLAYEGDVVSDNTMDIYGTNGSQCTMNAELYLEDQNEIIKDLSKYITDESEIRSVLYCNSKVFVFCPMRYYYYDLFDKKWNRVSTVLIDITPNTLSESFIVVDNNIYFFSTNMIYILNTNTMALNFVSLPKQNKFAYVSQYNEEEIYFMICNTDGQIESDIYIFNINSKEIAIKDMGEFDSSFNKSNKNISFISTSYSSFIVNKNNLDILYSDSNNTWVHGNINELFEIPKNLILTKYFDNVFIINKDSGDISASDQLDKNYPYLASVTNKKYIIHVNVDEKNRCLYLLYGSGNLYISKYKIKIKWW